MPVFFRFLDMLFLILKAIVSSGVVLGVSYISGKLPKLAGFLAVMPVVSLLAVIFSHIQYGDKFDMVNFYKGMLVGLPALVLFYLPFLFVKNFYLALTFGFISSIVIFIIYKELNLL